MLRMGCIVALGACIGACSETKPPLRGPEIMPDRIAVTGFLTANEDGDEFELIDLAETKATALGIQASFESILDPWIEKGYRVGTHDIVRLEVLDSDGTEDRQEYTVFLGGCPGSGYAEARFDEGSTTVRLFFGWVYLVGQAPKASTDRVITAAEGSELAIQIVPGSHHERVFLLESSGRSAWVKSRLTDDEVNPWTTPNTYVEFDENGRLVVSVTDICSASDEVQQVAATLRKIARKGLLPKQLHRPRFDCQAALMPANCILFPGFSPIPTPLVKNPLFLFRTAGSCNS